MNLIFATGLFDSPWVVAVIIIVGAIINWLSQRRQAKQQPGQRPEGDVPPSSNKPQAEFNVEEMLRRLLGEEVPPPSPVPPPVPRTTQGERSLPPPIRQGAQEARTIRSGVKDSTQASKQTAPVRQPSPMVVARSAGASFAVPQSPEQAMARFEQLNEQGRHPARALDLRPRHRSGAGARAALWRDRASMRRAFVASLVFGPPKGLES